jgi:coproporphyrinogen III oxidase-like Fe-S oxidoreductase
MAQDSLEKRNFLFFLNSVHAPKYEDSLIGALVGPSTWDEVAERIATARQKDAYVRSIKKLHLYVHVPFCGRLCTFCGCNKILLRRRSDIDAYVKVVTRQMMQHAAAYKGMEAPSISFGGGTPSILDEEQLTVLFDGIDKAFPARDRKIFFEISPASWTASKQALLSSRGILSRLSIGVQSMEDNVLKQVSRSQTRQKVLWSLRSALKAGVPNVNVDLIAGLPGQTIKGLLEDLRVCMDEGAHVIHIQALTGSTLKELCGPGETIPEFHKRRNTMMKEAVQILKDAGFRYKRPDGYARNVEGEDYLEEAYMRYEAAVAAFGPFAIGQFPGAVFYRMADFTAVNAVFQDFGYAMSHYAVLAIINGLDEKEFYKRFGVSLDQHCGEGLRYLQEFGLASCSDGVWGFSGKWEFRRVREFHALLRVLFGEDILSRLRTRFRHHYDPQHDYSGGVSLINDYANNPLMGLYYSRQNADT